MAISHLMEVLSISTPSTRFHDEGEDIHHYFSGRKINEQLQHYQKIMAHRSRISSIHELCNLGPEPESSPVSPVALAQARSQGISHQRPLPPYESLELPSFPSIPSLPRLPGVREVRRFLPFPTAIDCMTN